MASWVVEQWRQVRGNLKYDLIRQALTGLFGGGMIAAASALLHKRFVNVDPQWFIFGSVFAISLLLFVLLLIQPLLQTNKKNATPGGYLTPKMEYFTKVLRLGELWSIPTGMFMGLSVELVEISSPNDAVLRINSGTIRYYGTHVDAITDPAALGSIDYRLPRSSVAEGADSVCHWRIWERGFRGFFVFLDHANVHSNEVSVRVHAVDVVIPEPEPEPKP